MKHLPLVLAFLVASACARHGPYLRLATATAQDLEAAQQKPVVWYEFQPGDIVPFQFGFFGVLEGAADLVPLRAKSRFYLVARKNLPMAISFDGRSFANPQASQSIVAVVPRKDGGEGAQVGWIHYLGKSGNPQRELEALTGN